MHGFTTDQSAFQRFILEQQKIFHIATQSLQTSLSETKSQLAATCAERDELQRHASTMENNIMYLFEHLNDITGCLQRQRDGHGSPVDVAALFSQNYSLHQQAIEQERVRQLELTRLRRVGSRKDAKILDLQNTQGQLQKRLRAYENKQVSG